MKDRPSLALVRIFALIGLAISAYLLILKLNGTISSIKGCGDGAGCANVLGSRWSQWFGLPVSAFSSLLYAGLLALTFRPKPRLLLTIACLLVGAALWFSGLQLLVIKAFCPWCFATHLIGLLTAALIWKTLPSKLPFAPALLPATGALTILVLGQLFGPQPATHLISEEKIDDSELKITPPTSGTRMIDMGIGKLFPLGPTPYLGPADADHVVVKYFDYTCGSCRDLEGDLEKLFAKHPGKIAVILNPTPLNRACNPNLPPAIINHKHACELARLSLAAWIAKPEAFPEVHKFLFSRPVLTFDQAKPQVAQLVGATALEAALKSPRINTLLASNTNDFRQLVSKSPRMPKLLIGKGRVMQGLMKDSNAFIAGMEKELSLK
ncbi:MAG: vitamin K epoxide reductase family protein [Verrucomicrobiaceae bacterium]